ncbi:MSMEG_0570 family nitrogen starvation response protein [Kineococcus sp. R8]|uniref:MSMEG_0570 family nitrogen starvation response protein n=1 Tax=Kineococcus siccus TaxID=2696567 RepID=UPI001411FE6D|nr:MSMEG_0570 family nitrogen starvation response protein [Kineococcus siccus]
MPETTFTVRWPDGAEQRCWSPSLVVHDHLAVGASYPVEEFLDRTRTALATASERVRARYGFACTAAAAQLAEIEGVAAASAAGEVRVLSMDPARVPS